MSYESLALAAVILVGAMAAKAEDAKTFAQDVDFLKKHLEVIVLSDESNNAQVAVVPAYQGRVMTSTASGGAGDSFGWINHALIASGEFLPHINAFGGEDRFWMGPEGGQFAIFFDEGAPFDLETWQTPPSLDSEPFETVSTGRTEAQFRRQVTLANHSGTQFDVRIDRTVRLLSRNQAAQLLGTPFPESLRMVAYETDNTITNTGVEAWRKESGLLSIWILGMFNPSPTTTVVIPFNPGPEETLGPIVNDEYFGKVPEDRLTVKGNAIFFRGDGEYRSKIGVGPQRAKPILGSYAADRNQLSIVQFSMPEGATDYVNSMWEIQEEPYKGDVINAYNDGPPAPGKAPLGPFYEMESSSPAVELAPNASTSHVHRTFHIQGTESELDALARRLLNVSIEEIKNAF